MFNYVDVSLIALFWCLIKFTTITLMFNYVDASLYQCFIKLMPHYINVVNVFLPLLISAYYLYIV